MEMYLVTVSVEIRGTGATTAIVGVFDSADNAEEGRRVFARKEAADVDPDDSNVYQNFYDGCQVTLLSMNEVYDDLELEFEIF